MPSLASSLETATGAAVSADRLSPTTVAAQSLSDNTSLTASSVGQVGQAGQFATVPPGQLGVYSKTMVGVMEGKIIVEEAPEEPLPVRRLARGEEIASIGIDGEDTVAYSWPDIESEPLFLTDVTGERQFGDTFK